MSEDEVRSAWAVISETALKDIHPVFIGSAEYPSYLRSIDEPPPVLYIKGNRKLLSSPPGVSVVGTRKASSAGTIIAKRIARYFAEKNWTVVSGLALGIDAAAHAGALAGDGPTIAVLAHGLEHASPKANAKLGAEILEKGGAWASEYPVGVAARPEQFVLRNRIQIGLSAGSVIVEGEERSGTMTQAEFCLKNHRQLFAVLPERADSLGLVSKGPRILINKRGATPLRSKEDYESALNTLEVKRSEIYPHRESFGASQPISR
ncbi:DNA-processing protein DprA [Cupriavidus sp. UYPR2.512]|uniref:DNA-processing protein DprA n=1 Tax=Cupriavidus sp. UYPR2.512 TaxID=1080187 RepID=UPI0012F86158|nr:DNA-processing protein DprA [Cupriavidus sp. UYPR2.512]UIF86087.1 DNA-protecting protein DprA [Cupriavidus necator]